MPAEGAAIVPGLLARFAAEFEELVRDPGRTSAPVPIPKIADWNEASRNFVHDGRQQAKRPDWTYEPPHAPPDASARPAPVPHDRPRVGVPLPAELVALLRARAERERCMAPDRKRAHLSSRRSHSMVRLKRAYEPAGAHDGQRVLVERLWPRGVRKLDLRLDAWLKDVAPSEGLRRWFGHDPARFGEFAARYRRELRQSPATEALAELVRRASVQKVTLIYGARDETHNGAVVLRARIERALAGHRRKRHP